MKLIRTSRFKKDYKKLTPLLQKRTKEKLKLFANNPGHPSLNVKKVKKLGNMFEARINKNYRFFFFIQENAYYLVRIGPHDILDKNKWTKQS